MSRRRRFSIPWSLFVSFAALTYAAADARAGLVDTFTDIDAWRAAAGAAGSGMSAGITTYFDDLPSAMIFAAERLGRRR